MAGGCGALVKVIPDAHGAVKGGGRDDGAPQAGVCARHLLAVVQLCQRHKRHLLFLHKHSENFIECVWALCIHIWSARNASLLPHCSILLAPLPWASRTCEALAVAVPFVCNCLVGARQAPLEHLVPCSGRQQGLF